MVLIVGCRGALLGELARDASGLLANAAPPPVGASDDEDEIAE
jgi:hypothetical protein